MVDFRGVNAGEARSSTPLAADRIGREVYFLDFRNASKSASSLVVNC